MNVAVTHPRVIVGRRIEVDVIDRPSGFITSNYKKIVEYNLERVNPDSLYAKRRVAKHRLLRGANSMEILLKFSIFAVLLSIIL